ncbi:MAG: hypothetical protein IK130_09255 [Oscillospiraceae bacterium]|nr:hypothetical protein [Oscillospiraceae bacterium]
MKKKQYRRRQSGFVLAVKRLGIFLLATLLLIVFGVCAVMLTIAKGPLDSAKRESIERVRAYSATSFLADIFYTDEEIAKYTDNTLRQQMN